MKGPLLLFHRRAAPPTGHNCNISDCRVKFKGKFKLDSDQRWVYCPGMMRLALGFLMVLVIGCGGGDRQTTTITWWHFWTDATIRPVVEQIVREFEQAHPGVTVQLVDLTWADGHDKIAIAFSSGTGPDVVELGSDWIPEFSASGHLRDITEDIDSLRDRYLMWEPATYASRVYAFPWILGTRVLFANCSLLTRAGFDSAYFPSTWNELLEASQRIDRLADDIHGFASNASERHRLYKKFLPFLWAGDGDVLSSDGKQCLLHSPAAVAALEYYLRLCRTGLTDTQRRLEDAFLEGKIGFVISGDWLLKRMETEKPGFDFSTQVIPGPNGAAGSVSFAGGEYLAVNAATAHRELSLALVEYVCSPQNQLRFCLANRSANPSSRQAAADSVFLAQAHFATFVRQMTTSRTPPVHPQWVYIEAELERAIEAALYETKSPAQALGDASEKIEELLRR
jgi:multiple sugar transport system substrate-binding protein